jgi:hypothetical protein
MNRKELIDKLQFVKEKYDEGMERIKHSPYDDLGEIAEFTEWAMKMDASDCDLRPYMEIIFAHYRDMANTNPEFRKGLGISLGFLSTSIAQRFPADFHALFVKLKALSDA